MSSVARQRPGRKGYRSRAMAKIVLAEMGELWVEESPARQLSESEPALILMVHLQ
jgi:hypothetical protein